MRAIKNYWKKSGRMALSLAVLAGVLPIVLAGVLSGQPLRISSRADEVPSLRLWLEPATVTTRQGSRVVLDVIAEFENEKLLVPKLELAVAGKGIKYLKSFAGRVKVGQVEVAAAKSGTMEVAIDERSVFTGMPNLTVKTAGAKIITK